ncbi:uncharacterized protein LOC123880134 [Maniola jurtina]|uniref:uncharacterized protein LOC123880134 n=1 Tax=Maniola jurtina TaxID=191418 RepID=UPI001E68C711|nr:uncharacterized protein LOC123880134 [Maniola jurtina]
MVAELSIMNETNQNNSMNETAEEEDIMMEIDGHANNTSAGLSKPLDGNVGDENDASITVDKIREYFMKDAADAGDAVDTVIIFDTLVTQQMQKNDAILRLFALSVNIWRVKISNQY